MPAAPRTFRIVCSPAETALVTELLRAQNFDFEPEPFLNCAFRLTAEPFPLGRSLAAFFGLIYIQDRSSMLPPVALAPDPGACVLDMCASPGSKTGLLAQMVERNGLVVGNEPGRPRLATLRRNLHALNLLQTVTCSWPGEEIPLSDASKGQGFDFILLDPPCSGWGTVEKNPGVTALWKGDKIKPLITIQQKLLCRAAALLRPGGRLVYSTCPTNVDENEAQVRFANSLGLVSIPLEPPQGFLLADPLLGVDGVWRVDDADAGQGFFIAAFTKSGEQMPYVPLSEPATAKKISLPANAIASAGIDPDALPPGEAAIFGENVHFLPRQAIDRLPAALRWQGFVLGKFSGGRLLPSPRLRLSAAGLPCLELDDVTDINALLQGQSISTSLPGREAGLYWRGLSLGRVRLKNGRALWTEK